MGGYEWPNAQPQLNYGFSVPTMAEESPVRPSRWSTDGRPSSGCQGLWGLQGIRPCPLSSFNSSPLSRCRRTSRFPGHVGPLVSQACFLRLSETGQLEDKLSQPLGLEALVSFDVVWRRLEAKWLETRSRVDRKRREESS